jgi:hypothetical protein
MVSLNINIVGKTRQDTLDILKGMSLMLAVASKDVNTTVSEKIDYPDETAFLFEFVGSDLSTKKE